jgi:hypothetical protein
MSRNPSPQPDVASYGACCPTPGARPNRFGVRPSRAQQGSLAGIVVIDRGAALAGCGRGRPHSEPLGSTPYGRRLRLRLAGAGAGLLTLTTFAAAPALTLLDDSYPRAFFFRSSESCAAGYERWDANFSRLMGIMGKALDEEIPRSGNGEPFSRFKKQHPEQVVLLHVNGNARRPIWDHSRFFAGHWLYFNGSTVLSDVPAETGETVLRVLDASNFKTQIGRYQNNNEDIGLCALDSKGKPDWTQSEQVQLVGVDLKANTVRVKRGCYGTRPIALAAKKAYTAAHVTEGPWGDKDSGLLWAYNYATNCPRDARGQTCAEVWAAQLAELFAPDGRLAGFDGLEFDVLRDHGPGPRPGRRRGWDCDADGKADNGRFNGVNTYGIGVVVFCQDLRRRLGSQRLIMADACGPQHQRAFNILNGIESEGWPGLSDCELKDWSGGLNRQCFWAQNCQAPTLCYINHKYHQDRQEGTRPAVPFNIHRLVMAVACLTGSGFCYSYAPPPEPTGRLSLWDELVMGQAQRKGWLGKPAGPFQRLTSTQPDLLHSRGRQPGPELLQRLHSSQAAIELVDHRIRLAAIDPNAASFQVRLKVPPVESDLLVLLQATAAPMKAYPASMARLMYAEAPSATALPDNPATAPRLMSWVNDRPFTSSFYFQEGSAKAGELVFTFESGEQVWLESLQAFACPELMYREFEHGLVLANPSSKPSTFVLEQIAPGRSFRRLQGTPRQDPGVNNGQEVGSQVTLGAKDALFLIKQ